MAEAVVSFAVERLGDLLIQEVVFLLGVNDKVREMKDEITAMQCFLKDADSKLQEGGDEGVRNWVAQIRDVAYDAEDVIDKFIIKVASKRRWGIVKTFSCIFGQGKDLHMVGKEIEEIQRRINSISLRRENLGIKNIGEASSSTSTSMSLQQLRRSYTHVEDEDIIGLEKDIDTLVQELLKEEEEQLRMVSIVGMGGLGKTTLAKKVYKHYDVKRHFDCYAWTFISQQCSARDVLLEIIKEVSTPTDQEMKQIKEMNETDLVKNLHKCLERKKYLVVLDDLWRNEDWDSLKPAFPNGTLGSKIMLTTRNKEVALHMDARGFLHEPRCFTEDQSWELLCKKVFHGNVNTTVSPALEKIGRDVVRKCGGLPLAVAVLGGLLAAKESANEWEKLLAHITLHLSKGQLGVNGVLALSYIDLPYRLKPCFLYLGLFPEDCRIPTKKLIKLWVAEGFIRKESGETMEEMGEEYLAELISRCMVQMGERGITGGVKTIQVHDLMRDICIRKAREENFLDIFDENSIELSFNDKLRRRAIHSGSGMERYTSLQHSSPSFLRTLLFFNTEKFYPEKSLEFVCKNLELLRVLDISNTDFERVITLPREIGKLIHLRYLGLRSNAISLTRRTSIGNLQSLQTLDTRGVYGVSSIANEIWKIEQLRHLYLEFRRQLRINTYSEFSGDSRIDTLVNLQTLWRVKAGSPIVQGLAKLSNLRKLGIYDLTNSQAQEVLNFVATLKCPFRRLFLLTKETFSDLEPLSRCHHLRKLRLSGRIENLPQWPPNLVKLELWNSYLLLEDQVTTLQDLPNLIFLRLSDHSYEGKKMVFSTKGFPQLQFLKLYDLRNLEDWTVEKGSMPYLKHLTIHGCHELKMVPEGLRFITSLKELDINYMLKTFTDRIREGGEDWYKVQHIPSIKITVPRRIHTLNHPAVQIS